MAEKLPEYQSREQVDVSGNIPDFGGAMREYGEASTAMLSYIGSSVATAASQKIATEMGYEMGKDPKGDLFPAITNFDKALKESYTQQSYTTLSNKAHGFMAQAETDINQQPMSAYNIQEYNKKIGTGLKQISDLAPTDIKSKLESQFGGRLIDQNKNFQEKLYRENLAKAKDNHGLFNTNQNEAIATAARNGDEKTALELLKSSIAANESAVNDTIMTKEAANAANRTARVTYLSAKYTGLANKAKDQGRLEEFKLGLSQNVPDEIGFNDYPAVMENMLSSVQLRQNLESQNQSLKIAQFNMKVGTAPLEVTDEDLLDLQANVTKTQYENAKLSYQTAYAKALKSDNSANSAMNNWTSTDLAKSSPKAINKAFERQVEMLISQRNAQAKPINGNDAEREIAANAAMPVPAFIHKQNSRLSSANPEELENAISDIQYMRKVGAGGKLSGLNKKALAMEAVYLRHRTEPDGAQKAYNIVYAKGEKEILAAEDAIKQWVNSQKSQNESNFHFFKNLADVPPNAVIRDLPSFVAFTERTFTDNMVLTAGDEEASKKMLKDEINAHWGITYINRQKEYSAHPMEQMLDLPPNSLGVIKSNAVTKLNEQFADTKKYYDEGRSDSWLEAKLPISHAKAIEIKKRINEINSIFKEKPFSAFIFDTTATGPRTATGVRSEYYKLKSDLNAYNAGQSLQIIKHWRAKEDDINEAAIVSSPYISRTDNPEMPIVGGWNVVLKTPNGQMNIGRDNPIQQTVTFQPEINEIKQMYKDLNADELVSDFHVFLLPPNINTMTGFDILGSKKDDNEAGKMADMYLPKKGN